MACPVSIVRKKQAIIHYRVIFCFLALALCHTGYGQKKEPKFTLYATAGVSWRSTAMNFFNFRAVPQNPFIPYDYERNIQGVSVTPGLLVSNGRIGIEYYLNLRYDVTHTERAFPFPCPSRRVKEFIVDQNVNLVFNRNRKVDWGLGLSVVNTGKGFAFENPIGVQRYHNIQFTSYNAFAVFPLRDQLFLELRALLVPHGFPDSPGAVVITYSARAFYRLKLNR